MNRFYLIDKPIWISSFDIIRNIRKKLNIKKIWHTWTLDPLASWGVILATWDYTKLIPYLEKDKKVYEFTIKLDWKTASFDLAEEIEFLDEESIKKNKKELTKEKIQNILNKKFSWEIFQIPPKYSAIKINGQRAYKLAREWKKVEIKPRKVNIFKIEILDYKYPELSLKAEVSAWTYIRSIASDLGEILKTWWYITKLRRVKIWNLDLKNSNSLESFDEKNIVDIKKLFSHIKFIELDKKVLSKINNWMKVLWDFDYKIWEDLFVFDSWKITNIVYFDWKYLIPKKKI